MRGLAVLSWVYVAALIAFAATLLLVGESWWVGTIVMYLPRLPLALPIVVFLPLARTRARRPVLAVQAALALAITVALARPHVSFGAPRAEGPTMRVLSYNVWYGRRGLPIIEKAIVDAKPDIVMLQAMSGRVDEHMRNALADGYVFHSTGEFLLASRYPIVDSKADGRAFIRYTLETPLGRVDAYNLHAISPRPGLATVQSQSKRTLLTDGPSAEAAETVQENTATRDAELGALVEATAASKNPVLIAGDTNVPDHSRLLRRHLARFQDGFAAVGTGFGYTFPSNKLRPWMRIDRILSGPELRFTSFAVGDRAGSDHCPIWADLTRR